MPKVGDKHFEYTPSGVAKAEEYAEESGREVEHKKYKQGGQVAKTKVHKKKWKKDPLTGERVEVKPIIKTKPHKKHIPKHRFDTPSKARKLKQGGELNGPSHKEGGIPIEAEGGEFIIKKDSVKKIEKKHGKKFLEKLNEFGGVPVTNAKERSKKVYG